jgi:hypothetical protein
MNGSPFVQPDEKLKKIRSVLTVVDGRIAHDAGGLQTSRY